MILRNEFDEARASITWSGTDKGEYNQAPRSLAHSWACCLDGASAGLLAEATLVYQGVTSSALTALAMRARIAKRFWDGRGAFYKCISHSIIIDKN